jgi:hypothetical protein
MAIPWKPVVGPQKGDLGVLKAQVDLFEQDSSKRIGSNATLRVEAPKNGQLKNIKFAADYRRAP